MDLDYRVLQAIDAGHVTFEQIRLAVGVPLGRFRNLDRSLQRLRKAGDIRFHQQKWVRTEAGS